LLAEADRRFRTQPVAPDPAELANRCGLDPDPWQHQVLCSQAPGILLNCSRQSGKSTVATYLALWEVLCVPDSLTLILSPSERQSKRLFRKVMRGFNRLGRPVTPEIENKLELELANGSQLYALPASEGTIRGFDAVSLLLIDEAGDVPDDLYRAVRPMLAVSGGRIVAMGTPKGKRGWWWREWSGQTEEDDPEGSPEGDWERVEVDATMCPRIPPAFLAKERRSLGVFFEQEYMCRFLDAENQIFPTEVVEAAVAGGLDAWF